MIYGGAHGDMTCQKSVDAADAVPGRIATYDRPIDRSISIISKQSIGSSQPRVNEIGRNSLEVKFVAAQQSETRNVARGSPNIIAVTMNINMGMAPLTNNRTFYRSETEGPARISYRTKQS